MKCPRCYRRKFTRDLILTVYLGPTVRTMCPLCWVRAVEERTGQPWRPPARSAGAKQLEAAQKLYPGVVP